MLCLQPEGFIQAALGQQRRKRQRTRGWRGEWTDQSRNTLSHVFLDPCRYSQGCLLHFSTVPPYLLLNQLDESFMHRKLKNTAEEYVGEGGDERKQQEKDEGEGGSKRDRGRSRGNERMETETERWFRKTKTDRDEVSEADGKVTKTWFVLIVWKWENDKRDSERKRERWMCRKMEAACCCGLAHAAHQTMDISPVHCLFHTVTIKSYESLLTLRHVWTGLQCCLRGILEYGGFYILVHFQWTRCQGKNKELEFPTGFISEAVLPLPLLSVDRDACCRCPWCWKCKHWPWYQCSARKLQQGIASTSQHLDEHIEFHACNSQETLCSRQSSSGVPNTGLLGGMLRMSSSF